MDALRTQYEAYPYPARRPEEERQRLITGSPSHWREIEHYLRGGHWPADRPFRALVAGGGTGDATIMLAQQLKDAGIAGEVVYLDLSRTARDIAEARAAVRGLDNIRFETGSLLDVAGGPYDHIDCCGVLHHLDDPAAGLAALVGVLAEDGGLGLMLYGELGRTGVYPIQDLLRRIAPADLPDPKRVDLARRLLDRLPSSNWLKRNPFLQDHLGGSDAALYDLLLHSRDRPYRVPQVLDLVAGAGLRLVSFIEPALYEPATYLQDPGLARMMAGLVDAERWAAAEEVAGSLTRHVFYAVRADNPVTPPDPADPHTIPVLRNGDGPGLARAVRPNAPLTVSVQGQRLHLPLPRLAGPILTRIDGETSLNGLYDRLVDEVDRTLARERFHTQFRELYTALAGVNLLLLRRGDAQSLELA